MIRNVYKILLERYETITMEDDKENIMAGLDQIESGYQYKIGENIVRFEFALDYSADEPGEYQMDQEDGFGVTIPAPANLTSTGIPYFFKGKNNTYVYCNHPTIIKATRIIERNNRLDIMRNINLDEYWSILYDFFNEYYNS